ncbi:hypothetical protein [Curtobacterium sp. MCSS17_015]|uniref:hypothetical protein n=1 Tax=Curtobacterium sp. MCSS17_015 TaxID=2175666 RepID=UPI000DA9F79D|nr:hypothetical protein [Curtobacterium sp. MCSS17_015]WIB25398.1 hypothetical protein DEJ18_10045 [Curtobacterium sp. MCSS17_015]
MPHASHHLNDKQLRVLRWVERGCPDGEYVDDNYGHRITAKALASRGLLTITGHGPSWKAVLTAAGTARVAAEQGAPTVQAPDSGAQSSAAEELVARLDAAGRALTIDKPDGDVDYVKLVDAVNRSDARPRGKKLSCRRKHWTQAWPLVIEYDDFFWDLVDVPNVPPVAPRARLGAHAKTFAESKSDQFVTKELIPRASRVIEAFARYAEQLGYAVRDPREVDAKKQRRGERIPPWSGHVEVDTGDTVMRIQLREVAGRGGKKFEYYQAGKFDQQEYNRIQRLPAWQQSRHYWFVPTGQLEIRLARPNSSFDGAKWAQTKTRTVEDRLGEVFQSIEVGRLQAQARVRQAEEHKRQRAVDWAAAMEKAKRLFRDEQRRALIASHAATWAEYQQLESFTDELVRRYQAGEDDLGPWVTLAQSVTADADPFRSLSGHTFPDPKHEDLRPFLRGWSPYGPEHQ